MTHEQVEVAKHVGDGLSIGATVGAVMGFLPEFSAFLTAIWVAIRIYETDTVQKLLGKKHDAP